MPLARIDTAVTADHPARIEPELSLVPAVPPGERARQLLQDARAAAFEHLKALRSSLAETCALAEAVIHGGDLYTVGAQAVARPLAEELACRAKTLDAMIERHREAMGGSRPLFWSAGS
jgi:hypothetical protein